MEHRLNERHVKGYNSIDMLKFVLSLFVMIIHSGIDKTVISPLLRTAVPLFFIVSGYFFFSKTQKLTKSVEKKRALVRFIKRNVLLYLFWAVLQFPVVMFMRGYFHDLFPNGVFCIFRDMVLGNGFTGSWYIIALVIGGVVVYCASEAISAGWMVLITLPIYIVCCLVTNYWNVFDAGSIVVALGNGYHELTGLYFYTSFPVALFWISVGKFLAETKLIIKTKTLIAGLIVFGALLGLERYWIIQFGLSVTDDCYFMLTLFCPIIFLFVLRINLAVSAKFRIRELSTLLYVTHGCCGRIVGYILKLTPLNAHMQTATKLVLTLLVSFLICQLLIYLREKKCVSMFKYAY